MIVAYYASKLRRLVYRYGGPRHTDSVALATLLMVVWRALRRR